MSRGVMAAIVAVAVVVGTVAPAAAVPAGAATPTPSAGAGADAVGPATTTATTDALSLSPRSDTTLVPGGNYLFTLTATSELDAPTVRLTTTAASGVEMRTVSAPDSDLTVDRVDAHEYVVDSAGRLYADRTILVYVHVDETTAVDELNVTAAVDGGPTVSRSYAVVPRASADSRATLARQARARANMARSYAEMNDTLFADEPVSEAIVAGLLDGFTLVGTEYAKGRILGAAGRYVPGVDEFLQAQALGDYASGSSFYHDLFDVVVGILPDTTFDGLDADKGASQGDLANALRRVAHHADAEADAWERGNRSDARYHVRQQRARLCADGQDTYTPGTYHDLEARDYDCVRDEAYDQRDGIDAPHLQNFSVHVSDWAVGVDDRLTGQVRPRARVPDPAVTTDRDAATVAGALRDLSVGESTAVTLRVSNGAAVSPRGVLSVSTGNLSVTRVERVGDGTVVDARQYAPGDAVNGADGDVTLRHPLTEVSDPYAAGQTRAYRVTVERSGEGDAWLRYRAALEAFAGTGTDGGPTWGRAPAGGATDQQGWPAAAVGVGDEGDEGDGGNDPPTVDAGVDLTVTAGETVTLTADATDPDGDALTYDWTQTSGPTVSVDDGATVSFVAPSVDTERTVGLRATATDADGASASDSTALTIRPADDGDANAAPTARTGSDRDVTAGTTVSLDASDSTDPDGDDLSYDWRQVAGPSASLRDSVTATPTVALPTPADRTTVGFEVTVRDGDGGTDAARVDLTVPGAGSGNTPPNVTLATSSDRVAPGEPVRLQATVSDPDVEATGFTYSWSVASGPDGGSPSFPAGGSGNVTLPVGGTYELRVVVDDGAATDAATATVVANAPPTAGTVSASTRPGTAVSGALLGTDGDGDAVTYEVTSGPGHGTATLDGSTFTYVPAAGYEGSDAFDYRVADGDGGTATGTVEVRVTSAPADGDDRFEPNDDRSSATSIPEGVHGSLATGDDDVDYYAVDLDRNDRLGVIPRFDGSAGTVRTTFVRPDGTDDPGTSWSTPVGVVDRIRATAAGTHYVRLTGQVDDAGSGLPYDLRVETVPADRFEPNDDPSTATSIDPGRYDSLGLSDGDDDYYAVDLGRHDRLTVRPVYDDSVGVLQYTVYGPDGDRVAASLRADASEARAYEAPADGTYRIRVDGHVRTDAERRFGAGFDYALDVATTDDDGFEPNDERANATGIEPGRHDGLELLSGEQDWYAVDVAPGERLTASVNLPTGFPDATLVAYGPDGAKLATDRDAAAPSVSLPANETGTYRVGVYDLFEYDGGPYSLSVTTNAPPTANLSAPATAVAGESVAFDATASRDPDGSLARFAWDVDGDGRRDATGATLTYAFADGGERNVTLTVVDDAGAATSVTRTVTVASRDAGRPTVNATAPATVTAGETVRLTADATDPDGDALTYDWTQTAGPTVSVDDGASVSFVAPSVNVERTVGLRATVTDAGGASASDDVAVVVRPADGGGSHGGDGSDGDGDTPGTATVVDGFEDGDLAEWDDVESARTTADDPYAGSRSLRLVDGDDDMNADTGSRIVRTFPRTAPDRLATAAWIDGAYYTDVRVKWRNATGAPVIGVNLDNYRSTLFYGGNGRTALSGLGHHTWYRIEFVGIDWTDETVAEVRVDGETVARDLPFLSSADAVSRVTASVNGGGTGATGGVDDVTVGANATANEPPTPAIDVDPATPTVGERVTVDASNATDPDGTVTGYDWTFAGPTEPAPSPDSSAVDARTYAEPGTYDVTLAVTDDDGATATATRTVTVEEAAPPAKPAATGTSTGDPHLTTFDGLAYDFQAAGEFVLVRTPDTGFEVQARQVPVAGADDVTVNAALATRLDGRTVTIDARDATPVSVDGDPLAVNATAPATVGDGRVYYDGASTYTVVHPGPDGRVDDGDAQVVADVVGDRVDVAVHANASRRDDLRGLLGDADGSTRDDLALPDGTTLDRPPTFDALYGPFRDGWLVNESTTLFDYDDGAGPSTYDRPAVPSSPTTVDDFPDADVAAARSAAAAAGLENGTANSRNAVLDYLLTGDESYFDSARGAPETPAANVTVPTNGSTTVLESTFDADLDGWTVGHAADARDGTLAWSDDNGGSARLHAGGAPGEVRMSRAVEGLSAGDRIEVHYAPERFAYAEAGLTLRLVPPDSETIGLDAENDHSAGSEQNGTMIGTVPRAVPDGTRIQLRLRIWPGETTVFVETVTVTGAADDAGDPFAGVPNPPTDPMPAASGYEDVDGDGDADFDDVIELLFEVDGYTGPRATAADFDDDGDADFADVIELLFRV